MTESRKPPLPLFPLAVATLLVGLAVAAAFWPDPARERADGTLLVLLPDGDPRREDVLEDLAAALGAAAALDLHVHPVRTAEAFHAAADHALVAIVPDGLALSLPSDRWQALATGRRRVPWNLRPSAVLVSRTSAAATATPWRSAPTRTVFGDSLSLVCLAPLCEAGDGPDRRAGVVWGDDPYDHRGVLLAARYGAFDHAIVRQWDAETARTAGWLPASRWRITRISDPVPDIVALAARRLPTASRMELQRALSVIGRQLDARDERDHGLETGLGLLGLDGFNLLLGPDFEQVRRRYRACWPAPAE